MKLVKSNNQYMKYRGTTFGMGRSLSIMSVSFYGFVVYLDSGAHLSGALGKIIVFLSAVTLGALIWRFMFRWHVLRVNKVSGYAEFQSGVMPFYSSPLQGWKAPLSAMLAVDVREGGGHGEGHTIVYLKADLAKLKEEEWNSAQAPKSMRRLIQLTMSPEDFVMYSDNERDREKFEALGRRFATFLGLPLIYSGDVIFSNKRDASNAG